MQPKALSIGGVAQTASVIQPPVVTSPAPAPAVRPADLLKLADIGSLGTTTLSSAAAITTKMTGLARTGDMDELGTSLNALVAQAKGYDPAKMKGFLGLIRKKVQEIKDHYATVDGQVTELLKEVDKRVALFRGRVPELEALYQANEAYHGELKALEASILAKVEVMKAHPPEVDPNDSFSAQAYTDWQTIVAMAIKKADDVHRAAVLCEMQGPQIRLMAQNSIALAGAFDDVKLTTIPALKQQFTLYLLNLEQEKGAELHKSLTDVTNDTIRKNAAKLGQATIKVQTAAATPTISIDTLKTVQTNLLTSLNEVQRIRAEMQTRIAAEQPQLLQLSQELSTSLAQKGA